MATTRELFFYESEEDIKNLEQSVSNTYELLNRVNLCFHVLGIGKLTDIRQLELAMENLEFVRKLTFEKKMYETISNEKDYDNQWFNSEIMSLNKAYDDFVESVNYFFENQSIEDVDWEMFLLEDGCLYVDTKTLERRKEPFRHYKTSTSRRRKIEAIEQLIEAIEEAESLGLKVFNHFDSPLLDYNKKGYSLKKDAI